MLQAGVHKQFSRSRKDARDIAKQSERISLHLKMHYAILTPPI